MQAARGDFTPDLRPAFLIDAAVTAVDPGAIKEIHKAEEFIVGRVYPFRAAYWVSLAIGAFALLLTVTGIYGVLSYLVTQRIREIGIRMALGATASGVTGLVLKQLLRLAGFGLPLGTIFALGASHMLASRFVMMKTFDLVAFGIGMCTVLVASVGAAWFPARRAARVDPLVALRYE